MDQDDVLTQPAPSASAPPPAVSLRRLSISCSQRALLHDLTNAAAGVQLLVDLLEGPISDEVRSEYLHLLQGSMQQFHSRIDHEKKLLDERNAQKSERDSAVVYRELLQLDRILRSPSSAFAAQPAATND